MPDPALPGFRLRQASTLRCSSFSGLTGGSIQMVEKNLNLQLPLIPMLPLIPVILDFKPCS